MTPSFALTPKNTASKRAEASNRLDPHTLAEALETLLGGMLDAHEQLLAVTREHREALSQADRVRMSQCASRQAEINVRIESLNREQSSLLMAFRSGVSLREVLSTLGECDTQRSEELGRSLKEVVVALRREQTRLALASSSLAQHMQGLIQQIHRTLSHAGVYSTHGKVEAGAVIVSGLDVTS